MLSGVTSAVCDASEVDHGQAQLSAISTSSSSGSSSRTYTPPSSVSPVTDPDRSYSPTHYPQMHMNTVDFDQYRAFSGGVGEQAVLPQTWYVCCAVVTSAAA